MQLHQVGSGVVPYRRRVLGAGGVVRAVCADLLARRALQGGPPLPQSVAGIRESWGSMIDFFFSLVLFWGVYLIFSFVCLIADLVFCFAGWELH